MAVNIPETAIRQPLDQLNKDASGLTGLAISWKGPYDDLETASKAISQGDTFEGMTVSTLTLTTIPGGWGQLTISFSESSASSSGELAPISDKWSIKSCRNDVSILGYCGKDDDSPNRVWIECWQRETNAKVAKSGNFTLPDGTSSDLALESHAAATSELMAKIERGYESVMRFYPIVQRKRVYSDVPGDLQDTLGFIDTPTSPGVGSKAPVGLSTFVAKYQWLKCQDDCDPTDGTRWIRTESWMGIKKANEDDSPWDANLYGPNRWPMPYHHSQSDGGASS